MWAQCRRAGGRHREAMTDADVTWRGWTDVTLPSGETFGVPAAVLRHVGGQPLLVRDGGEQTPGAPVVLLVHGWCADGLTNWFRCYEPLREAGYRVVGVDLPGHGGSLLAGRFSLRRCGELIAALARDLAAEGGARVLGCGYSMGGPVLQLAQRHDPGCVDGVVYAATAARVVQGWSSWSLGAFSGGWGVAAELAETGRRVARLGRRNGGADALAEHVRWMAASCDLRALAQAGRSLARYDASGWVGRSSVPAAMVCTTKDRAVVADAQRELARLVDATVIELEYGHTACLRVEFAAAVLRAVQAVDAAGDVGAA